MLSISVLSSNGFSTTCRTPAMAARRRTAGGGITSNEDDRNARVARLQCAQHRETIHAGHVVIKNKTIGAHQVWMGQKISPAGTDMHLQPLQLESEFERFANGQIIIDNEDEMRTCAHGIGAPPALFEPPLRLRKRQS